MLILNYGKVCIKTYHFVGIPHFNILLGLALLKCALSTIIVHKICFLTCRVVGLVLEMIEVLSR